MRTFFGSLFEKIRGHVPRYPALALGLPSTPASLVPVVGAGAGAPTSTTHPVALWPIGSSWWRIDGDSSLELLYLQTAGGWAGIPLNGQFDDGIETNTIAERTSGSGVEIDGCLIKDGVAAEATLVAATSMYVSPAPVTATGSAQAVAHGLVTTPRKFWIELLGGHDGAGAAGTQFPTVTWGTVDATNLTVTVTAGAAFRLHALK